MSLRFWVFALNLLFALSASAPVHAQLQLTGIVHGPLTGAPKALELRSTEDIEDLSVFGIGTANNGTGSPGIEWSFPEVSMPANTTFYVSKESPTFAAFFGFPPDFVDEGTACNFNGDDAVELYFNNAVIDRYGDPLVDGSGQTWDYTLGWAFRDCNDDGEVLFNPEFWTAVPGALAGVSDNASATNPWPVGTFLVPCTPEVQGCTTPQADNYVPTATADDGSCTFAGFFAASGCTYSEAQNYDPEALFDDGTCIGFGSDDPSPSTCSEDLNANGTVDVGDLLALLGAFGASCFWEPVFMGTGEYLASAGVPVHYHIPVDAVAGSPIVLVFHGNARDAADYRDEWIGPAEEHGLIVLAPEFNAQDFPGSLGYMQGGMLDADGAERPVEDWTFSLIDPIVTEFQQTQGSTDPHVDLWGHSAGAQFVHRFMMFLGSDLVDRAVAANAGWYTTLDPDVAYPYGIWNAPVGGSSPAQALAHPLILSLGTADTLYAGPIHTPEADQQGLNRYDRGIHFASVAAQNGAVGSPWQLFEVQGVGHNSASMAAAAAVWLFGE